MSKITLEPNESGAGTFSIVSPDSNINRTLTLPDEDGTLVSDGGVLFVDSSNNQVGIGTTSIDAQVRLAVVGGDITSSNNIGIQTLSTTSYSIGRRRNPQEDIHTGINFIKASGTGNYDYEMAFFNKGGGGGQRRERMRITNAGNVGIGTSSPGSTLTVNGSLSKSSGSFKIDHPLKSETHHLVHSFVESPRADNVYRGTATLSNGAAQVNLDGYIGMTEGTFSALNGNIDVFLQNKTGWEPLKGEVIDNILHVYCRDETATDTISWMVVAERQDQHMLDTEWTDEFGRPILEPEKNPEPDEELDSDGEVI